MNKSCRNQHLIWSSALFFVVGALHLLRIVLGWDLVIQDWTVPMWVSGLAALITWGFVVSAWNLTKKK